MVLVVAAKATMKLLALVTVVIIVSAIVTTNILWDAPDPDVAITSQSAPFHANCADNLRLVKSAIKS